MPVNLTDEQRPTAASRPRTASGRSWTWTWARAWSWSWTAALGVTILAGCGSSASRNSASEDVETESRTAAPTTTADHVPDETDPYAQADGPRPVSAALTKLAGEWGTPEAVIVLSGQMLGYLEPCGCSADQKGGLGRRLDLVEQLKAKGWPLALVDLGSLINDPKQRGGLEQTKLKFDIALKALAAMDYTAFGVSADDLKIGVFDALGLYLRFEHPKAVAANVMPTAGMEAAIAPAVRATAGTVRLGITAAVDPEALQALQDPAKDELLTVQPPAEALGPVLADLERDTDVQILLVQGELPMAKDLAARFPGFDILLVRSLYPEPPETEPIPLNDGTTWVLHVGKKGMHVGLLGIFRDPARRFRYQDIALTRRGFGDAEAIRQLINEDLQALFRDAKVVEDFPRREHPSGATLLGAKSCQPCHPLTYARWEATQHAHGYESLVKRGRIFDAECHACHSTGLEFTSGFRSAEQTPHLMGNQCENCHGPGSLHASAPDNKEYRQAMALKVDVAKNTLCVRCHDEDNSPKFSSATFPTYWGKIVHSKMDTYDDPKVHQGRVVGPSQTAP